MPFCILKWHVWEIKTARTPPFIVYQDTLPQHQAQTSMCTYDTTDSELSAREQHESGCKMIDENTVKAKAPLHVLFSSLGNEPIPNSLIHSDILKGNMKHTQDYNIKLSMKQR